LFEAACTTSGRLLYSVKHATEQNFFDDRRVLNGAKQFEQILIITTDQLLIINPFLKKSSFFMLFLSYRIFIQNAAILCGHNKTFLLVSLMTLEQLKHKDTHERFEFIKRSNC